MSRGLRTGLRRGLPAEVVGINAIQGHDAVDGKSASLPESMAHHQPYLSAQANANDAGRAVLVGGVALICVTFVPAISETAFATIERWQNCGRLQSTGARSSNRWRAPPILQSPIPGWQGIAETLAICGPVAIFPIPISDVLGTTQHRQVNVFEAGLMERRSQRGFENPRLRESGISRTSTTVSMSWCESKDMNLVRSMPS